MIFAYTVKGYGLEIAGRPQNHSALLNELQIDAFRELVGLTRESEWDRFSEGSAEADLLAAAAARLNRAMDQRQRGAGRGKSGRRLPPPRGWH